MAMPRWREHQNIHDELLPGTSDWASLDREPYTHTGRQDRGLRSVGPASEELADCDGQRPRPGQTYT